MPWCGVHINSQSWHLALACLHLRDLEMRGTVANLCTLLCSRTIATLELALYIVSKIVIVTIHMSTFENISITMRLIDHRFMKLQNHASNHFASIMLDINV